MSSQIDIEMGELPQSNQETTSINADGPERYVNITQSL